MSLIGSAVFYLSDIDFLLFSVILYLNSLINLKKRKMSSKKWLPEEIYRKVSKVIVDEFNVKMEIVTPEAKFEEDFGAKLFCFNLFLFEIENVFSILFEHKEIDRIFTVKNLVDLINQKIN